MRTLSIHLLTVAGTMLLATPQIMTAQDESAAAKKPETLEERSGYFFGTMLGRQLKDQGMPHDIDQITAALKDVAAGNEPVMSEDDFRSTMQEAQALASAKMKETMGKEGAEFLAANKEKDGVQVSADVF